MMTTFGNVAARLVGVAALLLAPAQPLSARRDPGPGKSWTFSDLYDFTGVPDGYSPIGDLIEDAAGNLYGVTFQGGSTGGGCGSIGCGIAFEMSPAGGGAYTETIVHSFSGESGDGCTPVRGLFQDGAGNLYGTLAGCGANGLGIVYELSPGTGGAWTETILYSFAGASKKDGSTPYSSLLMDARGRLYGTTYTGGTGSCKNGGLPKGCGTVFELRPAQGGGWKETVLHSFTGGESDGANPEQGMSMDAKGNLYGVTQFGGPYQGTLYEMTPGGTGAWTETVIHHFPTGNNDGTYPAGIPALDSDGNLFGTTGGGGKKELGTLWEASPGKHGSWSEHVLYSFGEGGANDAEDPYAGVIFGRNGNLYGTTVAGGGGCQGFGCGTVYSFDRKSGSLTVIFSFASTNLNSPESAVLMDSSGNLFGTNAFGGAVNAPNCQGVLPGCGSVYELSR
jgi:uncharacterized repeat protein (TIGR03803 family)